MTDRGDHDRDRQAVRQRDADEVALPRTDGAHAREDEREGADELGDCATEGTVSTARRYGADRTADAHGAGSGTLR